jgi:hypothetical protein
MWDKTMGVEMGVFLILGILGVGFYVVLLLALFIDGRKSGKHRVHFYHQLELGGDRRLISRTRAISLPRRSTACRPWMT